MADFESSNELSDKGQTIEELYNESRTEENWFDHLDLGRQSVAAGYLNHGLRGRLQIFNGFEFVWLSGSTQVGASDRQKSYEEAFDQATRRIQL